MYACQCELMSNDTTSAIEQIHQWRSTLAWRMLVDTPACTCFFFFNAEVGWRPSLLYLHTASAPRNRTTRPSAGRGCSPAREAERQQRDRYPDGIVAVSPPARLCRLAASIHIAPFMHPQEWKLAARKGKKKRNIKITLCGPGGSLS